MLIPLTDEQQIDYMLSEMLGAWQLGDIEKLHKDYADDVAIVNGSWAPPILGWNNYLAVYQQQRARMQQVRMDRSNTGLGVLPVGLRSCCGRPTDGIPGPDYCDIREAQQPLGHRAQSHFARTEGPASCS